MYIFIKKVSHYFIDKLALRSVAEKLLNDILFEMKKFHKNTCKLLYDPQLKWCMLNTIVFYMYQNKSH